MDTSTGRFRVVSDWEVRANELAAELRDARRMINEFKASLSDCDNAHMKDLFSLEETKAAYEECIAKMSAKNTELESLKAEAARATDASRKLEEADERRKREKRELAAEMQKTIDEERARTGRVEARLAGLGAIITKWKDEAAAANASLVKAQEEVRNAERDTRAASRARDVLQKENAELSARIKADAASLSDLVKMNAEIMAQEMIEDAEERAMEAESATAEAKKLYADSVRRYSGLFKAAENQRVGFDALQAEYAALQRAAYVAGQQVLQITAKHRDAILRLNAMLLLVPDREAAKRILNGPAPQPMKDDRLE